MTRKAKSTDGPILVGVDALGHSDEAVIAAVGLARRLDAPLELVHAADISPELWSQIDPVGIASAREATWTRLSKALERAKAPKLDASVTFTVVPGAATPALVERAEQTAARLIVLGRHQRHGGLDFGNTVRAVLAKAPCPVWVQAGEPRKIRRVLCAVDLAPSSSALLALARDYVRALDADITLLHVFVRPELGFVLGYPVSFPASMLDSLRENAQRDFKHLLEPVDWKGVVHRRKFVDGDPALEIFEAAADAELIVMGTHGRSALARALVGSVAAKVLRDAKVPVLVLPGEA